MAKSLPLRWQLPDSLPRIVGNSRWVFGAVWLLALATCCWSATVSIKTELHRIHQRNSYISDLGFYIDGNQPFLTVTQLLDNAQKSGLRRGDRVISVAGAPLSLSDLDALERQFRGDGHSALPVVVISSNHRPRHLRLLRDRQALSNALAQAHLTVFWSKMLPWLSDFVLSFLIPVACALLLIMRRSRDALAPWASLMALIIALGFSTIMIPLTQELFKSAGSLYLFNYVSNTLTLTAIVIVLTAFPDGRFRPRLSVLLPVVSLTLTWYWSDTLPRFNSWAALMQLAAVGVIAARLRFTPPGPARQQIRWTLLGFGWYAAALAAGIVISFAQQANGDAATAAWLDIAYSPVNGLSNCLPVVFITISLLRYRLYDADAGTTYSITYGVLTVCLVGIFAGSEKVIELIGEETFGERFGILAGGISAALAAVCIGPLHHRILHWSERRFRSGLTKLRTELPEVLDDLRDATSAQALADEVLAFVEKGVRAQYGAVVMDGKLLDARDIQAAEVERKLAGWSDPAAETRQLNQQPTDELFPMCIPLTARERIRGWLLLGPRPDGSTYGRDERETLKSVGAPIAAALSSALHRERQEVEQLRRYETVNQELARLSNLVSLLQLRVEAIK